MTSKFQPLLAVLMIFSALVFTSCGDDKETEEELINADNLTAATWTFVEVVDAADANSSIGLGFFAPASLTFSDDNTYVAVTSDGQFDGTWTFANNTLTFEDEESPTTFEVQELTSSRMILYFNDTVFDPNSEQEYTLAGGLLYTVQ